MLGWSLAQLASMQIYQVSNAMQSTGQIEKHPESLESALPVGSNLLLLAPLLGCRLPLGPSMVMYGSVSYHLPLLGFYPSTFLLFICRQSYDPCPPALGLWACKLAIHQRAAGASTTTAAAEDLAQEGVHAW
jgi:hypothetical protein